MLPPFRQQATASLWQAPTQISRWQPRSQVVSGCWRLSGRVDSAIASSASVLLELVTHRAEAAGMKVWPLKLNTSLKPRKANFLQWQVLSRIQERYADGLLLPALCSLWIRL